MPNETDKNPESLKNINALEVTQELKDFVVKLASDVETEQTNARTWQQNVDKYKDMRYGIRKAKTHPWPNCANYSIPLIDSRINRFKPAYVNLVFGVNPVVTYEPFGGKDIEPARKRELLFDWRLKTKIKPFENIVYGIDLMLEQGATVFKTLWKFETNRYTEVVDFMDFDEETLKALYDPRMTDEMLFAIVQESYNINMDFEDNITAIDKLIKQFREGKTKFDLEILEIKEDKPAIVARSLREDITIPLDTIVIDGNLDNARFIDDKIWTTKNDLKIAMRDGKYEKYSDYDIDSWARVSRDTRTSYYTRPLTENDQILIHETCVWFDVNDDGIKEKCIVTWIDAVPEKILRFIELPYDHGQWPYTLVKREINDPGVYSSRGIPQALEDFQQGTSTFLNQAVDNGTIVNTPKVIYKRGAIANIRNARYIPGEPVEVTQSTTDYEIRQQGNASQPALLQLAQYLTSWADNLTGDVSNGLSDPTQVSGSGEQGQKTAREVNLIAMMAREAQSLELQVFQNQICRVYEQLDALYEQFGSDEEEILITGEQPIRITRAEIQGKFNIYPTGKADNSTPVLRAQKTLSMYQLLKGNPNVRQYELDKLLISDWDSRMAQKILKTEEELAQEQEMQMQQMQMMQEKQTQEAVQMKRLNDIMEIEKEAALAQVQGRKYAEN